MKHSSALEKLNLSDNLIDEESGNYLTDMIRSLTGAESLPDVADNLNIPGSHNPFNERTILRLVCELSSGLS